MSYPTQPYPANNPTMPSAHQYPSYNSVNPHAGTGPAYYGRDSPQLEGADSYPPRSGSSRSGAIVGAHSEKYTSTGHLFEKSGITRGSIAAQMAAEGQIPKKEGLKLFRSDEHAGGWFRGGKMRCCGRVCCCSIILAIIIVVSAIASFLIYTQAPDITFNGIEAPMVGSEVGIQTNGFLLNLGLNINVLNPNSFGATFSSIRATATYSAAPKVPFGGGSLSDVTIPSNSNTTIHFPFTVNYTTTIDPGLKILNSISTDCGFNGSPAKNLVVDYTIVLALKVLSITISPSFSSSASFACPLSANDISSLLGVAAGTTNTGKRSLDETLVLSERQIRERDAALDKVLRRGLASLKERSHLDSVRLFW